MDFALDTRTEELLEELSSFMDDSVYPAEALLETQLSVDGTSFDEPQVIDDLRAEARRRGLWNLFLTNSPEGAGLTNVQYAALAETTGRSPLLAPQALNCSAPDTGNMEILASFGSEEQRATWLEPLMDAVIRSAFCMTEPGVASSDATNLTSTIRRDGEHYLINGRKWWSSGAMSPRCKVLMVMGVTDPEAHRHRRQSLVLVPIGTPGVNVVRPLSVFGYFERSAGGHAEITFDDVRVPATNLIGDEGDGFAIAQARLGPGRVHHCMRLIGAAERALELMCSRALSRVAFGKPLAEQGVIGEWIADARVQIEQARLLVLKTAWLMDTVGNRSARTEISAIKVAVPAIAERVIDKAIQVHGGAGLCQDFPLAMLWTQARFLRIADGPDEVHRMALARRELSRFSPRND